MHNCSHIGNYFFDLIVILFMLQEVSLYHHMNIGIKTEWKSLIMLRKNMEM